MQVSNSIANTSLHSSAAGFDSKRIESQGVDLDQRAKSKDAASLRSAFDEFVGQTFYSEMMKSMRKTVDKPAYFHGGRAEEVFQAEMDQLVVQELAEASASQFTGPMFDLFQLNLKS